jgi:hypothetical protein
LRQALPALACPGETVVAVNFLPNNGYFHHSGEGSVFTGTFRRNEILEIRSRAYLPVVDAYGLAGGHDWQSRDVRIEDFDGPDGSSEFIETSQGGQILQVTIPEDGSYRITTHPCAAQGEVQILKTPARERGGQFEQ